MTSSSLAAGSTMAQLSDADFKYGFTEIISLQFNFNRDCFGHDDKRNPDDSRFALAVIRISDVLDEESLPVTMTDGVIEDFNDTDYISNMTKFAQENGNDCFPPVVVLDRGTHYEWLDGQHRMTALHRAGIQTTSAYIQLGEF